MVEPEKITEKKEEKPEQAPLAPPSNEPEQATVVLSDKTTTMKIPMKLAKLSEVMQKNPDLTQPILLADTANIVKQDMDRINEFYAAYAYDPSKMKTKDFLGQIWSWGLKDNIGEKNCELLKWGLILDPGDKEKDKIICEQLGPLLEKCYYLGFEDMKNILLKCYATYFWWGELKEESIEKFKKRHDIEDDPDPDEQKEIREEFKEFFDKVNQKIQDDFKKGLAEVQEKIKKEKEAQGQGKQPEAQGGEEG